MAGDGRHRRRPARPTTPTPPPTSTEMVELIGELVDLGRAYETDDGVYLVGRVGRGLRPARPPVARRLRAGGGDREVVGADRSAIRPTSRCGRWPSRASRRGRRRGATGRPGWHTECVVMSLDLLGEGFDLHGGGQDLRFPHHENERAQAVALGRRFAHHWMHNGFVVDAEGEKMSKSLGNFDNLLDLIESYDPRAYRLLRAAVALPLAGRGRASDSLDAAQRVARRPRRVRRAAPTRSAVERRRPTRRCSTRFRRPRWTTTSTRRGAMALLFDTVRRANAARRRRRPRRGGAAGRRGARDRRGRSGSTFGSADARARRRERTGRSSSTRRGPSRDFARADAIRAELQAAGWIVETTATGTTVRR